MVLPHADKESRRAENAFRRGSFGLFTQTQLVRVALRFGDDLLCGQTEFRERFAHYFDRTDIAVMHEVLLHDLATVSGNPFALCTEQRYTQRE